MHCRYIGRQFGITVERLGELLGMDMGVQAWSTAVLEL
jgi:hypothetical protein